MQQPVRLVRMHPSDNVAVVATRGGLAAGQAVDDGLLLREAVPQGHKVALRRIEAGEAVRRYDVAIGYALAPIEPGSWVHEGLMRMPDARALEDLPVATQLREAPPLGGQEFLAYRNPDGSFGTRNLFAITTTVQCVAGVVAQAAERIRRELLPRFPHVDGVVAIDHAYGCGVAIDAPDAQVPIRTLRNLSRNPNFGGEVMVVSLGCEKLQPERLLPPGSIALRDQRQAPAEQSHDGLHLVRLQDPAHGGFSGMLDAIVAAAEPHLRRLDARRREAAALSGLVVGVQCGGSDALSGVTANPALGQAVDMLVRAGATVLFSEVTEVRDGVALLTSRARDVDVARRLVAELDWYDAYLRRGGADRSANTTPGNKAGGLSNIVEKAMGSIVKSGTLPIDFVLGPGEKLAPGQRGLGFAATPASDFVCGTLQAAAGMNVHVFTTGRGTPYGLAAVPVIKVSTRSELAEQWPDLIDVDAGRIARAERSIAEVGEEIFACIVDVASGRRRPWAERWNLHNALTLFNPAPIT